jgi:hypothetical protein
MLNYRFITASKTAARPLTWIRGHTMRKTAIPAGIALICALTSPVVAADMTTKAPRAARVTAEPVCLRWVQQNYSWYNYCDPVPYYPRATRYWWGF